MTSMIMRILSFLAMTLALAAGSSCGGGEPAETSLLQERGRPLDHQTVRLRGNPPIRFKKLFTIESPLKRRGFGFLEFSPDGKMLAASRFDGDKNHDVTLLDVQKREVIRVLTHADFIDHTIVAIAFVPPGDRLITGCRHVNRAFLWDVRTGKLLDTLDTGGEPGWGITAIATFPKGNHAIISCASSGLTLWNLQTKKHTTLSLEEHVPLASGETPTATRYCDAIAFTADGSHFATTVADSVSFAPRILIWDAKSCQVMRVLPLPGLRDTFAYAPDGTSVAATYYDPAAKGPSTVGVWDTSSGKKLLSGRVFDWGTCDLTYTRDGKYLLVAGVHKDQIEARAKPVVGVWDLASGKVVNKVEPVDAGRWLTRIAVSPDNKLLAVPCGGVDVYAIEF